MVKECRWIFTIKYNADDITDNYKAKLVAKGYTQAMELIVRDIFSCIKDKYSLSCYCFDSLFWLGVLALGCEWCLPSWSFRGRSAHGHPSMTWNHSERNNVCLVFYGLKQSPKAWFGRFTKAMVSFGYKQSQGDHTLFIKHLVIGKVAILLNIWMI